VSCLSIPPLTAQTGPVMWVAFLTVRRASISTIAAAAECSPWEVGRVPATAPRDTVGSPEQAALAVDP
jgi:hypothetical protein